jgi:multimeric flavodoxin WrbA
MKIMIVNGSPKAAKGSSEVFVKAIAGYISDRAEIFIVSAAEASASDAPLGIGGFDTAIFVFPLYVDGIPAHLLRLLEGISKNSAAGPKGAKIYALSQNGFYEARHNLLALDMMRCFCEKAGLAWGGGLAVGAGGMAASASFGRGPLASIGKAVKAFSERALSGECAENVQAEPNFPRFLYKFLAEYSMKQLARKNGVKKEDLAQRQ